MSAIEYTHNLLQALFSNYENVMQLYSGRDGALRLAREYGYGLNDSPKKERDEMIQNSYGYLCVRFYNLKPPIDVKEWIKEIKKKIKQ